MPHAPTAPLGAALTLAFACLALAGCTEAGPSTSIAIDFPDGRSDISASVPLDADGAMTAYEQLVAWANATGTEVAIATFSFGHCVDAIDHLPTTPGCSPGAEAYWALSVGGVPSDVGMDEVVLRDGDAVTWTYTPVPADVGDGASARQDPNPLGVTIDPPAPTTTDRVVLSGSVNQAARVSIDGGPGVDVEAGRWTLESQPLQHGWNPVTLRIEDGVHSVTEPLTLVRLASGTFEAKFTAYPLHPDYSDTVWYDPGTLASLPQYEGKATQRAPTFTVHDFMAQWQLMTGHAIEYSYSDSFGFGVETIDGVGNALSSGEPPWWCYKMDGESADLGISLQPMTPGAVVTWELAACA